MVGFLPFDKKNAHDNLYLLLDFLVKFVSDVQFELDLKFVFIDFVFNLVLLKIVDECILNHVRVVSGEELSVVGIHLLILIHVLPRLVERLFRSVELHILTFELSSEATVLNCRSAITVSSVALRLLVLLSLLFGIVDYIPSFFETLLDFIS